MSTQVSPAGQVRLEDSHAVAGSTSARPASGPCYAESPDRCLLALVVLAGLGLVALSSVVAGVFKNSLELRLAKVTPEHLGVALTGVVHGSLHSACSRIVVHLDAITFVKLNTGLLVRSLEAPAVLSWVGLVGHRESLAQMLLTSLKAGNAAQKQQEEET